VPATGEVTYRFFTTIDGTGPHADQTVTLNPDGTVPKSALRGPLAAGAYSFVAVYSGDHNYASATSAVEPLTVGRATRALVTEITDVNRVPIPFPFQVPLGTSIHDTAAITGQHPKLPATGTVTYEFFTTIDGTGPHTDEVVKLNPDGTVPDSAVHGPLAAGSYSFVAVYSGDRNHAGATSAVEPLTVQRAAPVAPPSVTSLKRLGFHDQPTALVLSFSATLDPTTAQDVRNYQLVQLTLGPPGRVIPIASATYDPATNTVTLRFSERLALHTRYRLTVNGSTPGGVTGASGLLIDGAGTGSPGSNYVRTFGPEILVNSNPPSTSVAQARYIAREVAGVLAREARQAAAQAKLRHAAVDAALPHLKVHKAATHAVHRNRTHPSAH
jgi:hypothetical protein